MTYARDEAIRLIQWILGSLSDSESLCVELPFRDVKRKADLAILSEERLSAIEIKSARDNTYSLLKQIEDYREMFLDVTIATAPRHLDRVRSMLPREVGIILLATDSIELLRKPIRRTSLSKQAASAWLGRQDLDLLLGRSAVRSLGVTAAREFAANNISRDKLSSFALSALSNRNAERFAAFQRERSDRIDLDDLHMLALQNKIRR